MSQLNATIKVAKPLTVNSHQIADPIELEILNLSNRVLSFNIDDSNILDCKQQMAKSARQNANNGCKRSCYKTKLLLAKRQI